MARPENCSSDSDKTPWEGSGSWETDSEYVEFGSNKCKVIKKRIWMKIMNFPVTGLRNQCLNSSCEFNKGVPRV